MECPMLAIYKSFKTIDFTVISIAVLTTCIFDGHLGELKCEYLHVMYSINMLHYINIRK